MSRNAKVEKSCIVCGANFLVPHCRKDTAKTCSDECRKTHQRGAGNPNWKGGLVACNCESCGKQFQVKPGLAEVQKYCSYDCRFAGFKKKSGEENPNWNGEVERTKECKNCGKLFDWSGQRLRTWKSRVFCGHACAVIGQVRKGVLKEVPKYGVLVRSWANLVVARDNGVCQHCGAIGGELHAHHIKPVEDFREFEFDLSNGLTLCGSCHTTLHK